MMNRNPADNSNNNNNALQSQAQQQQNLAYDPQQQFTANGSRSSSRNESSGSAAGNGGGGGSYSNTAHSVGFQGDANARRYTLSASLGASNGVSNTSLSQQQQAMHGLGIQMEGGGGGGHPTTTANMMGNHSQRSHHSQQMAGFRGDLPSSNSPNNSGAMQGNMSAFGGTEQLSPTHLAHRMSLGFHPMSGGSGASPGFGAMADMDLSGRGIGGLGGTSSGGGRGQGGSAVAAGGSSSGHASQAEREEELLLNLLIARRQRGRMSGEGKGGRTQPLAEELMRLRQSRAAAGGNLPSLPGMPPLFETAMSQGGGMPTNMYPGMDYHMKSDMNQRPLDMSERIDRSPGRFQMADARMSDLSDRGFKRSIGMPSSFDATGMNYQSSLEMQGLEIPPAKKKRTHKKKPADMPRRPLSAYNLFFSEERERILKEIEEKEKGEQKEGEDGKDQSKQEEDEDKKKELEQPPKALLRPLIPSQKKRRPHRKTHGKISFQQLARMVGERWKSLPDKDRKYYQGLAQEDMKRQKIAMEEYYAKQNAAKGSDPSAIDKTSAVETNGPHSFSHSGQGNVTAMM